MQSVSDHTWLRVTTTQRCSCLCAELGNLATFQGALKCFTRGQKQRRTVVICRMVHVLAFVQTSSDAAPPLPENIRSAEGFTIRQNPFWGCSQRTKSAYCCVLSTLANCQGQHRLRREYCCPAPAHHPSAWVYLLYL